MSEIAYTRQQHDPSTLAVIEAGMRAAYPGYLGMIYNGGRQYIRFIFDNLPTEAEQADIANILIGAGAMTQVVTYEMEIDPLWQ